MKKIITLSLLAVLILALATACSNDSDNGGGTATGGTTGRYVEQHITPAATGQLMTLLTYDGNLAAFDRGLQTRFDSTDSGATWAQSQGPGHGNDIFERVTAVSFMPDGNLLAYLPGEGLAVVQPNGDTSPFPFAAIDEALAAGNRVDVSLLQVMENNQLLISYNIVQPSIFDMLGINLDDIDLSALGIDLGNIDLGALAGAAMEIGSGGEMVFSEGGGGATGGFQGVHIGGGDGAVQGGQRAEFRTAAGPGGGFTMFGFGTQTAYIYNMATGQQIDEIQAPRMSSPTAVGDFHLYQGNALMRHAANGDVDTILDGAAFSFSSHDSHVSQVLVLDDDSIIVSVEVGGQTRIYRYFWDANATINPDKILTVWSLHDNATVRAAISEIWRRNPDAYIVYEVALAGDGGINASDAIRTLNTRLLSGSGPDIIILDGVPIESYAGRGMLMDLSAVNTADMYQNLLAPFTAPNGNLYAIPAQLLMPVLIGTEEMIDRVDTLSDLVDTVVSGNPHVGMAGRRGGMFGTVPPEERSELAFDSVEELFDLLWLTGAPGFIVNNQLDSAALEEFLSAMLAISDMYNLTAPSQDMMMGMVRVVTAGGSGGLRAPNITGSLMQYMMQTTNMAAFTVDNFMMLQMVMERDDSTMTLFPGLVSGVWQPSTIAGVSADTGVEAFAIEFVNTLLSIQVQHVNHGEGLPVTRTGVEQQIAAINEILEAMDVYIDIDTFDILNYLHVPSILEETLREMIWETADRLTTGRIDLEGAVREIEQNLRNYLAERS